MWRQTQETKFGSSRGLVHMIQDFFKSAELIKTTAILSLLYSSSQMSLYGLSLSAESLVGTITINYLILGVVDMVANILLICVSGWLTRRFLLILSYGGLGLCCIVAGLLRLYVADQAFGFKKRIFLKLNLN